MKDTTTDQTDANELRLGQSIPTTTAQELDDAYEVVHRLARAAIDTNAEWHLLRAAAALIAEAELHTRYPQQRPLPSWLSA